MRPNRSKILYRLPVSGSNSNLSKAGSFRKSGELDW